MGNLIQGSRAWKIVILVCCMTGTSLSIEQTKPAVSNGQVDSSTIAPDGTDFVTRIVPIPATISQEAQRLLARPVSDTAVPETLAERRRKTDEWQNRTGKVFQAKYPVTVEEKEISGVPVRMINPINAPASNNKRVLINLHGGGFNSDSGSLTESIPVAYLS